MRRMFRAAVAVCLGGIFVCATTALAGAEARFSPLAVARPVLALPAPGSGEKKELWSGSLYSSTYRAGVCISDAGKMRGVLLLRLKNGKVDVYHFYGSVDGQGTITARHNSGHVFVGGFEDESTVSGQITLKNGFRIRMTGGRAQDVPLTETCRPLPE